MYSDEVVSKLIQGIEVEFRVVWCKVGSGGRCEVGLGLGILFGSFGAPVCLNVGTRRTPGPSRLRIWEYHMGV